MNGCVQNANWTKQVLNEVVKVLSKVDMEKLDLQNLKSEDLPVPLDMEGREVFYFSPGFFLTCSSCFEAINQSKEVVLSVRSGLTEYFRCVHL